MTSGSFQADDHRAIQNQANKKSNRNRTAENNDNDNKSEQKHLFG